MIIKFTKKSLSTLKGHVFTVENTPDGLSLIKGFRRQLKTSGKRYKVMVRGRGHRFGKKSFWSDLPIHKSTSLAVYLYHP